MQRLINSLLCAVRQALRNVDAVATTWKTLAGVKLPDIVFPEDALKELREAAEELDKLFEVKQADLVTAIADDVIKQPLARWEAAGLALSGINTKIAPYRADLGQIRKAQEGKDLQALKRELVIQKARKRRFEKDIASDIDERRTAIRRKDEIDKEKREKRAALTSYTKKVTEGLGVTINACLHRLGAGFRIDYRQPDYRGKEPAAAYNILINNVPVSPRTANDDIAKPTFKNTLSAGDKSVLALAIFLATLRTRADLDEMIVVLDDPFTSMDEFRRMFTVNEINKLVPRSA
jgi:wobble nucleotide-excising tRNase